MNTACVDLETKGTTKFFITSNTATKTDYNELGAIIKNRESLLKGVNFNVVAESNLHIVISKTYPLPETNESWEIVLGGWNGQRSVIRPSLAGEKVTSLDHSYDQFLQVISFNFLYKQLIIEI